MLNTKFIQDKTEKTKPTRGKNRTERQYSKTKTKSRLGLNSDLMTKKRKQTATQSRINITRFRLSTHRMQHTMFENEPTQDSKHKREKLMMGTGDTD